MLKFEVIKSSKNNLARRGVISTTHGKIQTPFFMPCATVGAIKGISPQELKEIGFEIILANTYHLYLRPGEKNIKKLGGIHKFINWDRAILTDSGGYQVFSLGKNFTDYNGKNLKTRLAKVTAKGVVFQSHLDGSKYNLSPEKVIDIQIDMDSDIIMVLDECTEYPAKKSRVKSSMEQTHQWAKRSIEYWKKHKNNKQVLFGIIQGGIYKDLREESVKFISTLGFDGVAVGGVSVGEGKANMYKVMKWVGPLLPKDKPHYLMGVGEPEDILEAVKWGFDMFDCVLPTRLGRHGTVWVTKDWPLDLARGKNKFSKIDLRKSKYQTYKNIIMKNCQCPTCSQGFSRAYISHLIKEKEMLGMRLASLHNLYFIKELINNIHKGI